MDTSLSKRVTMAKEAALEVLLHNASHGRHGLPRTAGWGYPEPYTRDLRKPSQIFKKNLQKCKEKSGAPIGDLLYHE